MQHRGDHKAPVVSGHSNSSAPTKQSSSSIQPQTNGRQPPATAATPLADGVYSLAGDAADRHSHQRHATNTGLDINKQATGDDDHGGHGLCLLVHAQLAPVQLHDGVPAAISAACR
jgi:hypothetical protein